MNHSKKHFYSHGKLLLTSEYLILDGVKALALPTQKGQWLFTEENNLNKLIWKSIDVQENIWFETEIDLPLLLSKQETNATVLDDEEGLGITETLLEILLAAKELNPNFLSDDKGYTVETRLEFDRAWGLGSSSTLINNIAQWAKIDAFELLKNSFGGSGYDIASAQNDTPILYTRTEGKPLIEESLFNPSFKDQLFFVYLNQKQDSKKSIQHYQSLPLKDFDKAAEEVQKITNSILVSKTISEFENLINQHEEIISKIIKTPTVKSTLFDDYQKSVKSLGGWGGDFILATGSSSDMDYFKQKGYETVIPYKDMII